MTQPEKRFKCGACEVSIFENVTVTKDGKEIKNKRASFRKRYKSADGEWKSANSLDVNDIPRVRLLLYEAYKYMVLGEGTEVNTEDNPHF
ncbi:MAG: hypothetical protein JW882_05255 [Deltaproteobacteria bacterium]|nr:hypothetical protein [Deltaproteobacteria bacterium]